MARYTELQRQELESFGYIVRSEKEMDSMDKKIKDNAKDNKPKTVPDSSKRKDAKVEVVIDFDESEDYSYLDELET
tara:strand:+ start:350 stop:577 length:228 start_codon:yes stop_codon:yes gene_type:complete